MFKGRVESISHEGGLLVSYTGACPALGSVMVDSNHEYVGKVDAVIGNLKNSLVHIAHLDRNSKPKGMIGIEIVIRTRKAGQIQKNDRRRGGDRQNRDDRRGNKSRNNNRWEQRGSDSRDQSRKNNRWEQRGSDSRDQSRRNNRSDKRDNKSENHSKNDWKCNQCQNINFSFRTECNRCGAKKGSRENPRNNWKGNDRRAGDRRQESSPRPGDWECPQCGKSNFARRNDCFGCGRQKRVGGPRMRGHHRKLKDPPPLHPTKYGKRNRRNNS